MRPLRSSQLAVVGVAYLAFIIMAMPETQLGVAWPFMQTSFQLSLDSLGILLITSRIGLIAAAAFGGQLIARFGLGRLILGGGVVRTLCLLGFALAPNWGTVVAVGLISGLGGGMITAVLNTYFAMRHGARLMNWLHASFGLGAFLGPVVLTALLNSGLTWRWGYATAFVLQGGVTLLLLLILPGWDTEPGAEESDVLDRQTASGWQSLKLPMMWLSMALFLVSAGIEASAGQWAFSLFNRARAMPLATAGIWVSLYWASFTGGRLLFGFVGERAQTDTAFRGAMASAGLAAALLWWNPQNYVGGLSLALLGLALAPISPLLTTGTLKRLGAAHAANGIGFQVGAAGIGIAALPSVAGLFAEHISLESLGPFLLAACGLLLALSEMTRRRM